MKAEEAARQRETLVRLLLTALLLYAMAHISAAKIRLEQTEALAASLEAEKTALEAEHAALSARLDEGESAEELEARARRELGLVRPGEIIFYFGGDGEDD